jgi:hypothetical protein
VETLIDMPAVRVREGRGWLLHQPYVIVIGGLLLVAVLLAECLL